MWKSLIKLEFLKNDQNEIGQIRIILMCYSVYLFGLKEIGVYHVWILGILLVAQIGEKIWKYVIQGLKIWKGKDDEI